MKKQILSLTLIGLSILAQAQNGNGPRWSPSGNTTSNGDFLGTINNMPLEFRTNNIPRFTIDINGNVKINSLFGTGNRFLTTDANGNLSALSGTNLSTFFNANNLGVLQKAGNDYYLPTGNLGIGIAPSPIFKLDVVGDARISNNLYVGGGIVITNQVQAATQIKGLDFKVDNSLAVTGASSFTGTANFKGALQNDALISAGISKVYSNAQGVLFKGPFVSSSWECVSGSPNWNIGGNNFNSQAYIGITVADIGTCDDADFILKSNGNPKIWLKNTGSNEYVGFGTANPQTNFHFSGGNLAVDGKIGVGTTAPNTKLEVVDPTNAQVCIYSTSNNAAKVFVKNALYSYGLSIDGNTQINNQVNGHLIGNVNTTPNEAIITWDGLGNILLGDKTLNTQVNTGSKLNVKGELDKAVANFVSNHSASFGYNTIFTVNNNNAKGFAVQNTAAIPAAVESFVVYGNGITQITTSTPNLNDDVFIIKDGLNTNSNNINFKVKKNGLVYSRELNVQLTAFPDYVFKNEYKLMSLDKLEGYIKTNHHLPNVPTAIEIEKNGANIGELVKVQMEKIEELTLYIIELKKEMEVLKKRMDEK